LKYTCDFAHWRTRKSDETQETKKGNSIYLKSRSTMSWLEKRRNVHESGCWGRTIVRVVTVSTECPMVWCRFSGLRSFIWLYRSTVVSEARQGTSSAMRAEVNWDHMDKWTFYTLGPALNFCTRFLLYPTKCVSADTLGQIPNLLSEIVSTLQDAGCLLIAKGATCGCRVFLAPLPPGRGSLPKMCVVMAVFAGPFIHTTKWLLASPRNLVFEIQLSIWCLRCLCIFAQG
jgi:hypothetical protein